LSSTPYQAACDPASPTGSQLVVDYRSDAELVGRVLAGEVDLYSVLVRRYQDSFFRFATRMLGSRDDADDALQSAFLRAYRSLEKCREPARFGAWLYQIVVNECRTLGARHARRERRMVRGSDELEQAFIELPESAPADLEEIQRALQQLPADQREAFVLKYVEELSYEEMSALVRASESALKMRVKRACDRLRELLPEPGRVS